MIPEVFKIRKTFFMSAAISAVCLMIFIFFILLPKSADTKALTAEVDELFSENEGIQSMILASKNSGQRLQNIQVLLEKYQMMVPPGGTLSSVLENIASRATGAGLQVLYLKPLRSVPYIEAGQGLLKSSKEQIYEVVIGVRVEGYFQSFANYLVNLENAPYKVVVQRIDIHRKNMGSKPTTEPDLSVELNLALLMRFSS